MKKVLIYPAHCGCLTVIASDFHKVASDNEEAA